MTTLTDKAILLGADNRPPMLENDMYDSWKSHMELYMMNRQHGRMILESVEIGPLLWPSIEENRVTRPKKYSELSATKAIQADCDVKATNIILQGLPPEVAVETYSSKLEKGKTSMVEVVTCIHMEEEGMVMEEVVTCTHMEVVGMVTKEVETCTHMEVEEMTMTVVETCKHMVVEENYRYTNEETILEDKVDAAIFILAVVVETCKCNEKVVETCKYNEKVVVETCKYNEKVVETCNYNEKVVVETCKHKAVVAETYKRNVKVVVETCKHKVVVVATCKHNVKVVVETCKCNVKTCKRNLVVVETCKHNVVVVETCKHTNDVEIYEDKETNELMDSSSSITDNEELHLGSSTFESCDDLLKSVRAFYYTKGYGLSIRDSEKTSMSLRNVTEVVPIEMYALLEKSEKKAHLV
nr:protein FAR1-related sequence 5 [Tanacetum cinerariifolium]